MNEVVQPALLEKKKCIITRHLGYKNMIPGAGQWTIITDEKNECWFCGQHILSLFIWTPRIGQLSSIKDPKIVKHFEDQIKKKDDEYERKFRDLEKELSGVQAEVLDGFNKLERKIQCFRKPKSQLIIEQKNNCAEKHLEQLIIEMEIQQLAESII